MKKIYIKVLLPIISLMALLLVTPKVVHADAQQQKADFEIQAIMPENQADLSLNYFDIVTKPDTEQTISLRIQNFTNKKIVVESDLRNAITQTGGDIGFTDKTTGLDPSLKVPFNTIVKLPEESKKIYLGPKETKIIKANIKMPKEKYDGVIYGDWHFIEKMDKNKGNNKSSVSSNYAYSMGVVLRGSKYKVYPDLKYQTTEPILHNRHPAMGVKLRNTMPMTLSNAAFKITVKKEDSNEMERTFVTTNSKIAPNSEVILPVSWAFDKMQAGTYKIKVQVRGYNFWNKLPMNWTFNKKLTVNQKDVDSINAKALKKPVNKWVWTAAGSGVLFFASLIEALRLFFRKEV